MNKKIIYNINRLAYPILLNYLLLNIFEILDKAIIGHYSLEGFALIGVVAPPIFEITGALGALSEAFNILAAEQMGKGNQIKFEQLFLASKKIAILISGAFILLGFIGGKLFFQTVYGLEDVQLKEALSYFYPSTFTVMLNMLIFLYSAYYRNKLCTKISLYSTAISTVVNLFFDVCLVNGYMGMPELGICGAAWGSVIGLVAGLMVYQISYLKQKRKETTKVAEAFPLEKKIFGLYPTLFGQEFLGGTLFTLVLSAVISRLSVEQMTLYNLLDSIISIISVSIYAYATSVQTYSLQQRAAGNQSLAQRYLSCGSIFTLGVMVILCTTAYVFRIPITHWIIGDSAVIAAASGIMLIAFLPVFPRVTTQIYMTYLQGIDEDMYVFRCMVIAVILASVGVMLAGRYFQLYGIYFTLLAQYLIQSILYMKKSHASCYTC